jgi:uncharacterized protein
MSRDATEVVRRYLDAVGALDLDALADDPGSIVAQYASDARILTTDRPYRNSYIARFQVRGGVITWFAEHFDPITLVEALGGSVTMPGQEVPA